MLVTLLLASLIGVSLGLLGGGGSILTVPLLVYVAHLDPKAAIATSLFVVGVTSLSATAAHARAGRVRGKVGLSFGAASMLGAFAGGHTAHLVSPAWLLGAFTVVMIAAGLAMLRPRTEASTGRTASIPTTAIVGVGLGYFTGLVGVGGGFLFVPALSMFCGLGISQAVATSSLVIAMNSLAGFAGHALHVHVDFVIAVKVTAAAVVGGVVGSNFAGRVHPSSLRRAFGGFVLMMAALMVVREITKMPAPALPAPVISFTPWSALAGGALIGGGASLLLALNGRIAGISGIFAGILTPRAGETRWRVAFVLGLLAGGLLLAKLHPAYVPPVRMPLALAAAAGLLVGFGTRLGNGCTSGHGVCGISRLSTRSIAATLTFMAMGIVTTYVMRHMLGMGG